MKARTFGLLALFAVVAWLYARDTPPVASPPVARAIAPAASTPRGADASAAGRGAEIDAIRPRDAQPAGAVQDPFVVRDWRQPEAVAASVKPPKPAAPVAAPAPTAPPLPFTVLGKRFADGRWEVFLGARERTYIVRAADTIERTYRVESVEPPLLTLTYLPLSERQTLPIGGAER